MAFTESFMRKFSEKIHFSDDFSKFMWRFSMFLGRCCLTNLLKNLKATAGDKNLFEKLIMNYRDIS
jgi:hypothetical protein